MALTNFSTREQPDTETDRDRFLLCRHSFACTRVLDMDYPIYTRSDPTNVCHYLACGECPFFQESMHASRW